MGFFSGIGNIIKKATGAISDLGFGISGGDLFSGALGLLGGIQQNNSAAGINSQNLRFQQLLSNTSYQRGVKDMEAAGLNPMLAYSQGGASTPSGSTYRPENVVSSATQAATANAVIQQMKDQNEKIRSDTRLNSALEKQAIANARSTQVSTAIAAKDMPFAELKARLSQRAVNAAAPLEKMIDNPKKSIGGYLKSMRDKADAIEKRGYK